MSKNTDFSEETTFTGTVTIKAGSDTANYGSGDLELEGTVKTDNITSNTISGNLSVLCQSIFNNTTNIGVNNSVTSTTGALNVNGDLALYNSNSKLLFNATGAAAPSVITRSTGTKIILNPNIGFLNTDTAIGIDNSLNIWMTSNTVNFYSLGNVFLASISSSGIKLPLISTPSAPSTGNILLYVDSSDKKIKTIDSTGLITTLPATLTLPLTTKGDILTYDGTSNTRFPSGTSGQILMSNSAATTGLQWNNYNPSITDNVVESYGTANTTINTTFTDIQTDQYRTVTNAGYLNKATNVDTIINQAGTYLVFAKVCLTKTSGTSATICTVKIQDDVNNTGTFTDVPGAIGYILCNSTGNGISDTCYLSYIRSYNANSRIKIVAAKTGGTTTDTITQRVYGVNMSVVDFMVDDYFDSTSYHSSYTTTSKALTTSYADIPVDNIMVSNSPFSYSSPNLTLQTAGTYIIIAVANMNKTSGTDDSLAAFQIVKNGVQIGTVANVCSLDASYGYGSICIPVIVTASAGDIIKFQGKIQTGTNLSCVSATLNAIFLRSSSNNQTNTDYIYLTSTSNTALATSTTDLPFQTEVIKSGGAFTHSTTTNTNEITINEDGYYYIFGNMTYNDSVTTIGNAQILTLYNNTISYNMYEGSYSEGTVNLSTGGANVKTITTHNFVYIPAGFKIKIQGLRISTGGTLTTVGSQCCLMMFKTSSISPFSSIKPFGDYFIPFASNYTSTTTSTTFIPKGLFPIGTIATGFYKLEWQYKNVTNILSSVLETQILLYTPQGTSSQIMIHRPPAQEVATNLPIYSGFLYLSLLQGSYTIEFDYRSTGGSSIAIRELQMAFYRVK